MFRKSCNFPYSLVCNKVLFEKLFNFFSKAFSLLSNYLDLKFGAGIYVEYEIQMKNMAKLRNQEEIDKVICHYKKVKNESQLMVQTHGIVTPIQLSYKKATTKMLLMFTACDAYKNVANPMLSNSMVRYNLTDCGRRCLQLNWQQQR